MKINGIGIVSKKEAMSVFAEEGRKDMKSALKSGWMTLEELGQMYKLEQVRKCSKIGSCGYTFSLNYSRIPDDLKDELTPEQLGKLVDAFYKCYGDGKNSKNEE